MSNISDFKRLGHRVIYTLNEADARQIIQERRNAGIAHNRGNDPKAGQSFPGIIVSDFGPTVMGSTQTFVEIQRRRWDMSRGATDTGEPGYPSEFKSMTAREFESWLDAKTAELEISIKNSKLTASVNIQVILDGTDTYWATSRSQFIPETHGRQHSFVSGRPVSDYEASQIAGPNDVGAGVATPVEHRWVPDPEGHFVDLDA